MIKKIITVLFIPLVIYPQTKILFTSIEYNHNEVRANICDSSGENKLDLGFNKTFLPVWFGEKILFNSSALIWQSDTSGENLKRMAEGFRVSVSHDKTKFAFYNSTGIGIADSSGKLLKKLYVDAWDNITITWASNDSAVTYYDQEREKCFVFEIWKDSLWVFGDSVYHPLWHPFNNKVLYNKKRDDDSYEVRIRDIHLNRDYSISPSGKMCVVPIWSNDGKKAAYFKINFNYESLVRTDMLFADLLLYDFPSGKTTLLAEDAGFTDQAFPQLCFDEDDENIYYTIINEFGGGSLAKVNISTGTRTIISKDATIDERFPLVKTF